MISRLEHNNSSKRGRPANPIRKSSYSMRIAHAPQYTLDWFKILNVALIAKYRSKSRLAVRRTLQRCDYSNIARIGKWKKLEIVTSRINLEKLSSCPALFSHFVEAIGDALRSWNHECCRISMEERLSVTSVSLRSDILFSRAATNLQLHITHYVHMRANIHLW